MEYTQIQLLSGKGAGEHEFTGALRGITVDQRGSVYAAGDQEIKIFDEAGRLRRRFPTNRPGYSVALARDGRIFAGQAGQVEIFDQAGRLLDTWRDDERLALVTAIGFAGDSVLLADSKHRCIRRFDRNGKYLHDIANNNRMKGLLIPNGVVSFGVDAKQILHVANPGKHRVERYTPEGELLGHFGRFDGLDPAGFPGCCNPTNVAVTDGAQVWVTEKAGPRAKVYDSAGTLQAVIAADVFDPLCKNMSLAVGSRGRVYIADTVKLAIFVFQPQAGQGGAA